jgi:hypothetical protein
MSKWEEIQDLTYMFTEITPELIIFLIYVDKSEVEQFKRNHQRIPKEILDINMGDTLCYSDSINGAKMQKNYIFMGKNTEGKYVLHSPNEPYIYDIAVLEQDLYKKGSIVSANNTIEDVKLKKKTENEYIGIANSKGIGYINSVILHLYSLKQFKENISFVNCNTGQITKIIEVLNHVNSLIMARKKVDPRDILDMIEILLPDYQNFEIGMC